MIYIKSIAVAVAFVLGLACVTLLLSVIVLNIALRLRSQQETSLYIVLHFRYFWVPCILTFVAGFIWAHRHFST